jgi:hypothetical protein
LNHFINNFFLGIGLYAREIGHSIDTEEDVEDSNKPSWFRTSPLDIGQLECLLNKKFTPLEKLMI